MRLIRRVCWNGGVLVRGHWNFTAIVVVVVAWMVWMGSEAQLEASARCKKQSALSPVLARRERE